MKTMKNARYVLLVLLPSLLMLLTGCERRELLDDYPVSGVQVKLNWNGVTDKLPEGMRIIFYPKDAEGRKIDRSLPATGGELKVPPGRYAVVVYNNDTETILLRDEESYEKIEAHPAPYRGLEANADMVWGPEPLYAAKMDELCIEKSDKMLTVELKLRLWVYTFSFEVKAVGLKNVSSITGSISGMDVCHALGCRDCSTCRSSPIFFEAVKGDGVIKGTFTSFGPLAHTATRSNIKVMMTLDLLKIDGEVQKVEVNITEVVTPPPPPPPPDPPEGGGEGGGEGEGEGEGGEEPPKTDIEIEIPVEDDGIVIEDVKPKPGEGGGIGGDVGDWGDEDNVELPVK